MCKPCYEEVHPGIDENYFHEEFFRLTKDYNQVGELALLEVRPVGVKKKPKDVYPQDRQKVLNIVLARRPIEDYGHIERSSNPMEDDGWWYSTETEEYGIESEKYKIE